MDGPKEIYLRTRTMAQHGSEKISNDLFMVTIPAPPASSIENKNLQTAAKALRALQPRHQQPKHGVIERQSRLNKRRASSFSVNPNDSIIFTSDAKVAIQPAPMAFLPGGHTSVNKWPVPDLLEQHMAKIATKQHDELWAADKDCVPMDEEDNHIDSGRTDDQQLDEDPSSPPHSPPSTPSTALPSPSSLPPRGENG